MRRDGHGPVTMATQPRAKRGSGAASRDGMGVAAKGDRWRDDGFGAQRARRAGLGPTGVPGGEGRASCITLLQHSTAPQGVLSDLRQAEADLERLSSCPPRDPLHTISVTGPIRYREASRSGGEISTREVQSQGSCRVKAVTCPRRRSGHSNLLSSQLNSAIPADESALMEGCPSGNLDGPPLHSLGQSGSPQCQQTGCDRDPRTRVRIPVSSSGFTSAREEGPHHVPGTF